LSDFAGRGRREWDDRAAAGSRRVQDVALRLLAGGSRRRPLA
jgi:hypothetical protein